MNRVPKRNLFEAQKKKNNNIVAKWNAKLFNLRFCSSIFLVEKIWNSSFDFKSNQKSIFQFFKNIQTSPVGKSLTNNKRFHLTTFFHFSISFFITSKNILENWEMKKFRKKKYQMPNNEIKIFQPQIYVKDFARYQVKKALKKSKLFFYIQMKIQIKKRKS